MCYNVTRKGATKHVKMLGIWNKPLNAVTNTIQQQNKHCTQQLITWQQVNFMRTTCMDFEIWINAIIVQKSYVIKI